MKPAGIAAACLVLALLTFFQFPGHTWLQQDSQIYAPILERLHDPSALRNEILATRPHVAYTLYDETALALRFLTRLGFRYVLAGEQILTRALGIWGLYLIALSLIGRSAGGRLAPPVPWRSPAHAAVPGSIQPAAEGKLSPPHSDYLALFVAALCSLGATIPGPTVLTIEYEPTPRAFALPLVVCAIGLAARRRHLAAGIAAAVAFLFHPPTALPFWALYAVLALRPGEHARARRWSLAPLGAALAVLLVFAHFQEGGGEAQTFLARLTPALEALQRMRASYNWISTWPPAFVWHYAVLFALLLAAFWRLRPAVSFDLGLFLIGLPALGMLSMPASWLLLEHWRWALIPQYQPMRLLLFVTLFAQLLAAAAGVLAAVRGRAPEAFAWFAVAYLLTVQPVVTQPYALRRTLVALALGAVAWLGVRLSEKYPAALAFGLIAFFALPGAGGVVNYRPADTPDLDQLSAWARSDTPKDAVFLFADAGRSLDAGVFRAKAIRAVYVDWKGGGQVNYLAGFAEQWSSRWQQTHANRFKPADLRRYEALGIQYIVLQTKNRLQGLHPAFENGKYVVYALAGAYRNAMVLMPETSKRFRHRRFLQATLSSSSTM